MTIFLGSGCLEIRIFGFPIQNKWGKFDFVPMKNIIVLIILSSGQVQVGFLGTMYITITKTSLNRMQSPDIMLQYIFLLRLMFYLVYKTYMKNSYFLH